MPTIRRLFLIIMTFALVLAGAIYALAYWVKPKIVETTITIPNNQLNLRTFTPPQNTITIQKSPEDDTDSQSHSTVE